MRQRNDTGTTVTVHTDPPQVVEPGNELDCDTYVVGFTVLNAAPSVVAEPTADAADDTGSGSTPKKTSRSGGKEVTA